MRTYTPACVTLAATLSIAAPACCRDRADERRRGLTIDDNEQLSSAVGLTAAQTQYLGGTMENTHLVRGLDRALLNQIKGLTPAATDAAAAATGAAAQAKGNAEAEFPVHFATSMGRAVAQHLLQPPAAAAAELFQPRRMAFVFLSNDAAAGTDDEDDASDGESDGEGGSAANGKASAAELDTFLSDAAAAAAGGRGAAAAAAAAKAAPAQRGLPEVLLRSKAECPPPADDMNAAVDARVLMEVVGVLKAVRVEPRKGGKRRGKEPEATPVRPARAEFHAAHAVARLEIKLAAH